MGYRVGRPWRERVIYRLSGAEHQQQYMQDAERIRWRIFKDPNLDYMPWWAQWMQGDERGDPRRFHSWDAAAEHVIAALR